MRIALINMFSDGSTGDIMKQIAVEGRKRGHIIKTYSALQTDQTEENLSTDPEHKVFGYYAENKLHIYMGVATGQNGMFSHMGTRQLINDLKKFKPDIIHLHNLHRFCINLPMLFRYINKNNIKVVWTLHDCWSFTGKCPHYTMAKCDKWKSGCGDCPQLDAYPKSITDCTASMYEKKKRLFTSVKDMVIVTPSQWLANQVKMSFMKEYDAEVIYNGIDLTVFKPTDSNFKSKINCNDKKIVLGVAFDWSNRKGLDVFNTLSQQLNEDYQIVLVGVNENAKKELSDKIITISRTHSKKELAEIYSAADVFVNPTREEVLGLVNIEALACGTPVITFDAGGSPETINPKCGAVVDTDDVTSMKKMIVEAVEHRLYRKEDCVKRAMEFNKTDKFREYIDLYENSTHSTHVTL